MRGTLNELALFAGAGGGILAGKLLGWRTVCAVERDAYAAQVLAQRQNDGILAPFPIWSDVQSFDGKSWRGIIDVISGGFPCQDISVAGKGAGITGKRSALWKQFARIIGEVRPRYVFVENSPMLTRRGLDVVLSDLAELRYDAQWGVFSAAGAGAPHIRKRIWIVANASGRRLGRTSVGEMEQPGRAETIRTGLVMADTNGARLAQRESVGSNNGKKQSTIIGSSWWDVEPNVGRVANGVANRVDRLRAIGNGQVPAVARKAWELLK